MNATPTATASVTSTFVRFVLLMAACFAAAASAQQPGALTFKVPYKFTNISSEYESFQIVCAVSKSGEATGSGFSTKMPLDSNGSASGTADIVAKANPGKNLSDSTDWACQTGFYKKGGNSMHHAPEVAKAGTTAVGDAKGKF